MDEAIRPIVAASVSIPALNVSVQTDAGGRFAFEGLEPGAYVVQVRHLRYHMSTTTASVHSGPATSIQVVLAADGIIEPYVIQEADTLFVSSGFCVATYCNKVINGNNAATGVHDIAYFDIAPNATIVQVEVKWDATTPIGTDGILSCSGFAKTPGGDTASQRGSATGPSPLTVRVPGTWAVDDGNATLHLFTCSLSPANGDVPASTMMNQKAPLYLHSFYNFVPDANWTFIANGAYPVPPR